MFENRGEADRSPGSMIIWGIGFLLIFLLLSAVIYMFLVMFLLRRGKKVEDEEQVAPVVVPMDSGDYGDSGAFKNPGEPLSVKSEVKNEVEETRSVCEAPIAPRAPTPTAKSTSLSKEPLTASFSQTDVGKDQKPPEIQNPLTLQESTSNEKAQIQNLNLNLSQMSKEADKPSKSVIASRESVKGGNANSIEKISESEASGYQMSSQRSEVNNFNMIGAGRTPPTDSRIEMIELAKKDSLTPVTTAIANSETAVSMTTPPIQKTK